MAVVGYATIQLIPSLQGFGNSVRGQIQPISRQVGQSAGKESGGLFGNSFVGSVGRIMSAAGIYEIGSRIASGFSAAFTAGIQGVANLQAYSISFETLLGSASKAQDMIKSLYSFAARTPFDVEGSVVGAQKLLGVGVAAKDVVPTLTTLGDAVGALGGSTGDFNSVLLAYSQIMARGKVSTQDLYQISNTGIPIFQLMSKALGKPVGEIQKLIETGKLASQDVLPQLLDVMNQEYGGAMAKQATTLTGLFSTMKDTVNQALTTAMTPLATYLQTILPGATTTATNAIQFISDKLGLVGDFFAAHKDEFATAFQPFADALANTDWEGLLGTIAGGLGAVALGLTPVVKDFGDMASVILPPLVDLLNSVGTAMGTAGAGANDLAGGSNNAAGAMGLQSQQVQATNSDTINLTGSLGDQARGLQFVAQEVAPFIGGLLDMANKMVEGKSKTDITSDALTGKFGTALQVSTGGVLAFGGATSTAIKLAVASMTTGAAVISAGFQAVVASIGTLPNAINIAVAGVAARLGSLAGTAVAAGRALVMGFAAGITSAAASAVAAVQSVVSRVSDFFPHSPAKTGPFSGKGWTPYSGAALVNGFASGIQKRQSSLQRVMDNTFTSPSISAQVPVTSAQQTGARDANLASTLGRGGSYIGAVNFGAGSNGGMVGDLNFMLRNLARGGR